MLRGPARERQLPLLHAAIPMRGPAVGCTIALLPSGAALLDPTADEERDAAAVVTLVYLLRDLQGLGAERQHQLALRRLHLRRKALSPPQPLPATAVFFTGGIR